ncbi:MAG: NERD domain-containing protein [Chloroflexi bacterium]|nr:NERD domain-containing protein [Chloroflexota bacterium]
MQTIINERLVAQRGRIGGLATGAGFVALIAGFIISLQWQELILVSYALLIAGFIAFNVGKYHSMRWGRWGRQPRPDEAIVGQLKSLDQKYQLFSWVPELPADHILLTPHGVTVLEVRPFIGEIFTAGDRWWRQRGLWGFLQFFAEGSLGNPAREAQRDVTAIKEYLAERLGGEAESVPVDALIVFSHPRVRLHVEDPAVPVVQMRDLKATIRRPDSRAKLAPALHRQVSQALREPAGGA